MIKVENLVKTFGPKHAVDGISFSVERGEVLGFLGPNGAGKSTTMRMVTGFIPPTAGTITVGGYDAVEHPVAAKRLIGYLPENAPAYTDMTVLGFLNFAAEMRGLTGAKRRQAVQRAAEICFIESVLHQSVDTLSKGYRHRTCFAQSIIHDPPILILDEPTDGLDPNQKSEVRSLIRRMGENKAIVFSTHILEEVDAACTRALIIDRGKIVANGSPEELRGRSKLAGAVAVAVTGVPAADVSRKLGELPTVRKTLALGEQDAVTKVRAYPQASAKNGALQERVYELAVREGWKLRELRTESGRLEEVFHDITLPDTAPAGTQTEASK